MLMAGAKEGEKERATRITSWISILLLYIYYTCLYCATDGHEQRGCPWLFFSKVDYMFAPKCLDFRFEPISQEERRQ